MPNEIEISICANCGLVLEKDENDWGHYGAAEPVESKEYKEFWEKGCADPTPTIIQIL